MNPQELIEQARQELAVGNFIKAARLSKKAGSLIDETQSLHRRFMELLKKARERTDLMEESGYDVNEARRIIDSSRDTALRADYQNALDRLKTLRKALNRATYTPFPLLNRNVDILTAAIWTGNAINYTVRIENPSSEPLGEIIIRPSFDEGLFRNVEERLFGMIGPKEYKESTFILHPTDPNWNIGIEGHLLKDAGIILRTAFSSRQGRASYHITIENNSDQIIRDVRLSPKPPGGLVPDPPGAVITSIEPFGSATVEFKLDTPTFARAQEDAPAAKERVIVLDEDDFTVEERPVVRSVDMDPEVMDEDVVSWEEEDENLTAPKGEAGTAELSPDENEIDMMIMSPYAYPDIIGGDGIIDKKLKKKNMEEDT
ncbi:MAG: hypothetical protein QCI82_00460 [Candidatus Thermoplasmatota archaeon]|nr:hypothetical protein [Candidatus Thermoplasmatota archaeon]